MTDEGRQPVLQQRARHVRQDYPEQPPSTVATASDLTPKGELEDRVPGGDASELRVRRCCAHTVEEDPTSIFQRFR